MQVTVPQCVALFQSDISQRRSERHMPRLPGHCGLALPLSRLLTRA